MNHVFSKFSQKWKPGPQGSLLTQKLSSTNKYPCTGRHWLSAPTTGISSSLCKIRKKKIKNLETTAKEACSQVLDTPSSDSDLPPGSPLSPLRKLWQQGHNPLGLGQQMCHKCSEIHPGGCWDIPGKAALPPCPGRHCTVTQDRQHQLTILRLPLLPTTQPPQGTLGLGVPLAQLFSCR